MNQELLLVIRAQNLATAQLNQLRGGLAGMGAQVKTATAAARSATTSFSGLWRTFKQLMPILGLVKIFQELKQAIGNATRSAIEFGEALHNLWTLTDMNKSALVALGSQIRDLARQFNVTGVEASRAMYQIYSATFYAKDAFLILEESIKGAVAGLSDVFNVADMMTTVLNAWRMEAAETAYVNDLLFTTIKYGKCLEGSSLVLLSDGRLEKIENLSDGAQVVAFDGKKFVPVNAEWVDQGVKPIVKLTTRLGREIKTTWTHPYLTEDGWKKVSKLSVGDKIAVPTHLPFFGIKHVPKEEAGFLGFWIAEGTGKSKMPEVSSIKYHSAVSKWAEYFGCSINVVNNKSCAHLRIVGDGAKNKNKCMNFLRKHKIDRDVSIDKHIPEEVFTWDKESVAELLHWLFNGDGWLCRGEDNGRGYNHKLGYGSKSETLVRQINHLMLKFGIVGRVREREYSEKIINSLIKENDNKYWVWECNKSKDIRRFLKFIGIDREFAKEAANRPFEERRDHANSKVSSDVVQEICAIYTSGDYTQEEIAKKYGLSQQCISLIINGKRRGPGIFSESIDIESQYIYDKIVKIEELDAAHVYDLVVPEYQNFIASDIIAHNTTMSELAHQFGRLAGVAAPAGAAISEMTAAIATLTRQGIATDWAITSLRQTLMQTLRPGAELAEVIRGLGFDSGRALIEALGFANAIQSIGKYADANALKMENLFTNVRAVTAVLPLATTAAGEYRKDLARMANAAGTATEAFNKQAESWAYQLGVLKTSIQDAGVTIGRVFIPALKALLTVLSIISQLLAHVMSVFNEMGGGIFLAIVSGISILTVAFWGLYKALIAVNKMLLTTLTTGAAGAANIGAKIGAMAYGLGAGSMLAGFGLGALGIGGVAATVKGLIDFKLVLETSGEDEAKLALKSSLESVFGAAIGGAILGSILGIGAVAGGVIGLGVMATAAFTIYIIHEIRKAAAIEAESVAQAERIIRLNIDLLPELIAPGKGFEGLAGQMAALDPDFAKTEDSIENMRTALLRFYETSEEFNQAGLSGFRILEEYTDIGLRNFAAAIRDLGETSAYVEGFSDSLDNLQASFSEVETTATGAFGSISDEIQHLADIGSLISFPPAEEIPFSKLMAPLKTFSGETARAATEYQKLIEELQTGSPTIDRATQIYSELEAGLETWTETLKVATLAQDEAVPAMQALVTWLETLFEEAVPSLDIQVQYLIDTFNNAAEGSYEQATALDALIKIYEMLTGASILLTKNVDGVEVGFQYLIDTIIELIPALSQANSAFQQFIAGLQYATAEEAVQAVADIIAKAGSGELSIQDMLLAGQSVESIRSVLEGARTGAYRIGDLVAASGIEAELAKLATMIGKTPEEIQAELDKAKAAADKASREAATEAAKALSLAQEAFRQQFADPILDAITGGDWMGAAEAINVIAARKDELIAAGAGLEIDASEVLGLISGMRGDLMSAVTQMVDLGYVSETVAKQLEEFFSPTVIYSMDQLREGIDGLNLETRAELARELISEQEQLIEDLKFFGMATEEAEVTLINLRAAAEGITPRDINWKDWIENFEFKNLGNKILSLFDTEVAAKIKGFFLKFAPENIQELSTALFEILPEGIKNLVAGLAKAANYAASGDMLNAGLSLLVTIINTITTALEERLTELKEILNVYIQAFKSAADLLGGLFGSGFFGTLAKTILNSFVGAIQMIGKEGQDLISAGLTMLINVIDGVVSAFKNLISQSDAYGELQKESSNVWKSISNLLGEFLWPLVAAIRYVREILGMPGADSEQGAMGSLNIPAGFKTLRAAWDVAAEGQRVIGEDKEVKIPAWAAPFGEALGEAIINLLEGFGISSWTDILTAVRDKASDLWSWITGRLPAIMGAADSILRSIGDFLERNGLTLDNMILKIQAGIDWIIREGPGWITNLLGWLDKIIEAIYVARNWLINNLPTWEQLKAEINRWINAIGQMLDFTSVTNAIDNITKAIDGMKKGIIYALAISTGALVGALAAGLIGPVRVPVGALAGAAGGALLTYILDRLGVFHNGGIVQGIPGQEVLIRAMPGEQVLTPAQQQSYGSRDTYVTGNTFILPNVTDPESFKREFNSMTWKANRRASGNRYGTLAAEGKA